MRIVSQRAKADRPNVSHLRVQVALGPVHKTAFGVAVGVVCGVAVSALTVFHLAIRPANSIDISLLAQYFYGYTVSWRGTLIGFFWGFVTGFVAGWFMAFVRNLAVAVRVFALKGKSELSQLENFLDHI
jgi:hypothetical protein